MNEKEKIIYFHMNQLGDLLFSLPFLAAARKQWPDKYIASYVKKELSELLTATGYVDEVIIKPVNIVEKLIVLKDLKTRRFSTAVHFSESPETALLSFASLIPRRAGFSGSIISLLYTETVERLGVPSIANNLNLAIKLGLGDIPADYAGLINIPKEAAKSNENRLLVISPGASKRRQDKLWPDGKWAELINDLSRKGFDIVICGSPAEAEKLFRLNDLAGNKAAVYYGASGIMGLARLLSKANLFIGIDSGAMHLAAALKVPVIGLFGPTDPAQIGPMPLEKNIIIKKNTMLDIEVGDILEKIRI